MTTPAFDASSPTIDAPLGFGLELSGNPDGKPVVKALETRVTCRN